MGTWVGEGSDIGGSHHMQLCETKVRVMNNLVAQTTIPEPQMRAGLLLCGGGSLTASTTWPSSPLASSRATLPVEAPGSLLQRFSRCRMSATEAVLPACTRQQEGG